MKVLFISHDATCTGAPIALLQELRFFKEHYKEISFELLLLAGGPLLAQFEELCIVHQGWRDYTLIARILRRFCKQRIDFPYLFQFDKGQFDVIYANTVASFKVAIELKKKLAIPLIGHVHEAENLFCTFNIKKNQIDEFCKLIAVSELTANNLMDLYNVPAAKIVIQHPISHWIDNLIKNKVGVTSVNLCPGKFVIGIFCNGGWWKGTEIIPFVIRSFYERYPKEDCEFVVVGSVSNLYRYHLEYDLRKMNVHKQIHWVGAVDNPLVYHACFDLFLLLSREESFSLAAQEAAFMKTPIVGFDGVTGAAEWIKHGAGSLVPYMDFDRMSEEIYKYYAHERLTKEVGNKAKDIVTEMYMNDSQMSKIVGLLLK